ARQPVSRPAVLTPLAQMKFTIPPMSTGYSAQKSTTLQAAQTLWGVTPHMHVLGRHAHVDALLPGAQSSCLIDIPAWNFHWQQIYFYDSPNGISLPAGTQVTYSCTWDNPGSTSVSWGEDTTDEMCIAFFYLTS